MRKNWLPTPTLALLALLPLGAPAAVAAPITATYAIAASGFTDVLNVTTPPADPVRLTFSLSFDPGTGDQFDYMTGIALLGSNLAVSGPLAFDYDSTNDVLTVGGAGLSTSITAGTNDVLAEIDGIKTGAPVFGGLEYTTAAAGGIYLSLSGSVAVPEPASMLLLSAGLVGLAVRRRVTARD